MGGSAPYQEKVFGWMEFPPSSAHWRSVEFAYPRLSELGSGETPPSLFGAELRFADFVQQRAGDPPLDLLGERRGGG